jgi:hypothetical protein
MSDWFWLWVGSVGGVVVGFLLRPYYDWYVEHQRRRQDEEEE